jgi:type III pantothenate kinase
MLLAIDAGNTNIVFAVFDGETLVKEWRLSTDVRRTADEYALFLFHLMELEQIERKGVTCAIISTVVPAVLFALRRFCRQYFNCEAMIVGTDSVDLGVQVSVERPSEVGADRLVNSIAAYKRFGGDTIIIDFGTATTFDVINKQGDYIGGVIAPGINLSLDALHKAAAKLPNIAIERPDSIIGKSTISAMQSGIYWGYVGLIEGILRRIQEHYGEPMKTVATGGLASLFYKEMKEIEYLEPDLTMIGLQMIYQKNN